MDQITLDKIKEFAKENFTKDPNDPETITSVCEAECMSVTNPWMDSSARWEIDDNAAVKTWGLTTVVDFIEKAKEKIV